jgi:hypothetical protein
VNRIIRKLISLLVILVLLLYTTNVLYAKKKITKRWWFWPAVTVLTVGIVYSIQQPEPIDYRKDSDGDTIPDYYEVWLGLDPYTSNIGKDSDGDGYDDVLEFYNGSDPLDSESLPQDDAHLLSIQSLDTRGVKSIQKFSITTNPVSKEFSIHLIMPLKTNIWLYGTVNSSRNNYKIQIMAKY